MNRGREDGERGEGIRVKGEEMNREWKRIFVKKGRDPRISRITPNSMAFSFEKVGDILLVRCGGSN
jgi:hypothetical protein